MPGGIAGGASTDKPGSVDARRVSEAHGADPSAVGRANAVAQARGAQASLPLVFEAGVMTVGPVSLGEAPRVY